MRLVHLVIQVMLILVLTYSSSKILTELLEAGKNDLTKLYRGIDLWLVFL